MHDPLHHSALRAPASVALTDGARSWTYRALDAAVDRLAERLARDGASAQCRVALLADHGPDAVIAAHAIPRSGAALVPLHPAWPATELRRCLDVVRPVAVVCSPELAARVRDAAGDTRIIHLGEVAAPDSAEPLRETARRDLQPAKVHSIVWTSGTANRPRGVLLTWANHLASAQAVSRRLKLRPDDAWYAGLALAHIGGLALVFRAACTGARLVIHGPFAADRVADLIDAGDVTHASLVPTMLGRLLRVRGDRPAPRSLRLLLVGGAAAPEHLVAEALNRGYPVALTYGMTEATSQVATAPPELVRAKPGTVGPPLDGIELRIGDEDEILVRGPTVAMGYVGESTLATGRWHRTGDRGRLDADGHLWVTGRLGDRILSGAVVVDPREVEAAILAVDGVREAAVVGVADDEWGEAVAALVVPVGLGSATPNGIIDHCRAILAPAKRPRHVRIVPALPRSANGKIDAAAVRAAFGATSGT